MLKILNAVPAILILVSTSLFSQVEKEYENDLYAHQVTGDNIINYIYKIADDSMEGRETGTPGFDRAADFVVSELKKNGVQPLGTEGYFQNYSVVQNAWAQNYLKIGNDVLPANEYSISPEYTSDIPIFRSSSILSIGNNSKIPKDVSNEDAVLMQMPEGYQVDLNEIAEIRNQANAQKIVVLFIATPDFKTFKQKSVFSSELKTKKDVAQIRSKKSSIVFISPETAKSILLKGQEEGTQEGSYTMVPMAVDMKTKRKGQTFINGKNVVAFIPGIDPNLKDEYIIISAHLDHLGIRDGVIYNGADDDGSGSSTILEMANKFSQLNSQGKGTRRSLVFVWFSGEEKGLLGSRYFASNPTFDMKKAVLNLNVDMIGRNDVKHRSYDNYVYLIGIDKINPNLKTIEERINSNCCDLTLDYRYNDENDPNRYYYRSDHYNFAEKGIPVIFYFSGVHEDYHKPTDDPDKIVKESLNRRARLIFYTILEMGTLDSLGKY